MRLKKVEPDSCRNCTNGCVKEYEPFCLLHNRVIFEKFLVASLGIISAREAMEQVICEDGYEDDNSRLIT